MHGNLLTMYRIAAMDSGGEDDAEGTPSKQKQAKKDADTETVKEEALDDDADGTA